MFLRNTDRMTQIIKILPNTKAEVIATSQDLIEGLESGEINPLELAKFRKCMTVLLEEIKPVLDKYALDEAEKYGNKFELHGVKFEIRQFGTTFSFDNCNDPIYERLLSDFENAKVALDERKEVLKALKTSMEVIDPMTGDVRTAYPPVKRSTTATAVSL